MNAGPASLFSWRRVYGLTLRHLYLMQSSWFRVVELAYWPITNMVLWGLVTKFLLTNTDWLSQVAGLFIGAIFLWDVMFRGNLGVAIPFLEEMWSRNLGNLFASPLRPLEMVAALFVMSALRTAIGVIPAGLLAIPLYHYSVFDMGWALLAFYFNLLVTGCTLGLLVSSMVLRFGLGAESLAWAGIMLIAPFAGIYHPISILPAWLQPVAWAMPPAYVFEGMRAVMFDGAFRMDLFQGAAFLNALYLGGALALFLWVFRQARVRGLLLNMGE